MNVSLIPLSSPSPGESLPFLQADFWSRFKAGFGWTAAAFTLSYSLEPDGESRSTEFRVLVRRLAGPLCFAYVPGGPNVDCSADRRGELLSAIGRKLRPHLPASCIFIRLDPPWFEIEGRGGSPASLVRPLLGKPLRKAGSDIQPPDTVLLSLEQSEDEILGAMKPKWRYNIRLASKKAVTVADEGSKALPLFYRLYEATSRRDRIAIHPLSYYERLFAIACGEAPGVDLPQAPARGLGAGGTEAPDLRLWVARHEGEPLAAIITLFFRGTATYLYGASSDEKRELMPSYALQWAAIKAARDAGCRLYDFYGIPPGDDPGHPMAGLYRFKTGFGGQVVHYAGSWDLSLSPLLYRAWNLAEALRAFWFKDLRKRNLRRP